MKEVRTSRWKWEEGEKVAAFLGQKTILSSSSLGGRIHLLYTYIILVFSILDSDWFPNY